MSTESLASLYQIAFVVSLILCGVFVIISVALFFGNKVGPAFRFLSGKSAKKAIQKITSDSRTMERARATYPDAPSRNLKRGNTSERLKKPDVSAYFEKPAASQPPHKPTETEAPAETSLLQQTAAETETTLLRPTPQPMQQPAPQPAPRPVAQQPAQPAPRPAVQQPVQPLVNTADGETTRLDERMRTQANQNVLVLLKDVLLTGTEERIL